MYITKCPLFDGEECKIVEEFENDGYCDGYPELDCMQFLSCSNCFDEESNPINQDINLCVPKETCT